MAHVGQKITDSQWANVKALVDYYKKMNAEAPEAPGLRQIVAEPERAPMAFGYRRCSHKDSRESGLGLEAQDEMVRTYQVALNARRKASSKPELAWGKMFSDEAVSARKRLAVRPAGREMANTLRKGDHVLIAKLDRGFRNLEDLIQQTKDWEAKGITVHFVQEGIDPTTAMGRLIMHILGAVAQWQAEYTSEQNKEICARMAAKGFRGNGHAPMGFKKVGRGSKAKLIPDIPTRQVMTEIFRLHDECKWSFGKISDFLERTLAAAENRKPVSAYNSSLRKWNTAKVIKAYHEEKAIRQRVAEYGMESVGD